MSEAPRMDVTARMKVSASEQIERSAPAWLAEAAVHAQVWERSGLLEKLQQEVHVPRGRMGTYVECDYISELVGYAASTEQTLKDFYERLEGFEPALAGLWGRKAVASRSALSRFLAAVTPQALEELRALLFKDLLSRGIGRGDFGGLIDRMGQHHVLFDMDGTKQPGRQRTLVSGQEYPQPRRRLSELCAPARLGRKRGEVGRTRTVVQQAHTGEWLGSFGGAGNGQMQVELRRGCEAVGTYIQAHGLEPGAAVVRLDGLYGYVPSILIPAQLGLGYLARCADYRLLEQLEVLPQLERLEPEFFELPDSGASRRLYDVGQIQWRAGQKGQGLVQARLVVTVRPPGPREQYKPRIGKRIGQSIYELFVTDRQAEGFSASDIVSLYLGRGAAEGSLAAEDRELEPDRLCSTRPCGQEWWQLLCQWVWNERLRLGVAAQSSAARRTLWAEPRTVLLELAPCAAQPAASSLPAPSSLPESPPLQRSDSQVLTEPAPPPAVQFPQLHRPPELLESQPSTRPTAAPALFGTVVAAHGRGSGRFAAQDFQWLDPRTLLCPAGMELHPCQPRSSLGRGRIRFAARAADCLACALAPRCLGGNSSLKHYGRRVTVLVPDVDTALAQTDPLRLMPNAPAPPSPGALPPAVEPLSSRTWPQPSLAEQPPSVAARPPPGLLPVFWDDLPSSMLRTFLPVLLLALRFDLCLPLLLGPLPPLAPTIFTRSQRAHRRLTYSLRLARNALPSSTRPGSIHIHGLPRPVSHYLAHPARAA
jgi:hypothetical protein